MSATLVWAIAILAFGVLLMACVLLLLNREPEESAWDAPDGMRGSPGQHLRHLTRLLRSIRAMNSLIVAEREGESLAQKACHLLTASRGYRMAWIGLVRAGDLRVHPVAQAGFENGYLDRIVITWDDSPTGEGPVGRAIKTGGPTVMRDIETAPEFRPWREEALKRGYRSCAAIPLRFKGDVLGALSVYAEQPEAFGIEEVGVLQEVADHLAYALASIRLEQDLAAMRRECAPARAAFDYAPIGLIVTDAQGNITALNGCVRGLLGAEGEERPRALRDLAAFRRGDARAGVSRVLSQREAVRCDLEVQGADKAEPRRLTCRGVPIFGEDGVLQETVWVVEDIAGRE
ncbi:MAG: GAF domain-containing protein [Candidatus Brocadiaceae bacterium]|nr:GAF domain-containing protein [Candidatus Brocadiaceae bacterium]